MSETPESIVEYAYDHITQWYLEWVESQSSPRQRYTQMLLDALQPQPPSNQPSPPQPPSGQPPPSPSGQPPPPTILDLGCGPGIPIVKMLLDHDHGHGHGQGAHVIANDISSNQIALARRLCPDPRATFIAGDMTALSFDPGKFDGVVSFYTLFHLPRVKLEPMLSKIHDWLKPGGVFVFNLATVDEEEIHGEFLGYGMFWSSYGVPESKKILEQVGFEVLREEVLRAGDGELREDEPDYDAEFLWVMVRKREGMST